MVLSEISQSELEIENPVSDGDQGVSTEHDGGASTRGFCKLGKEDPGHAGLGHLSLINNDHDHVKLTEIMTPTMLWTHMIIIASEHCPDVALPPYLE